MGDTRILTRSLQFSNSKMQIWNAEFGSLKVALHRGKERQYTPLIMVWQLRYCLNWVKSYFMSVSVSLCPG
jgi:hypothetical protein